ncbi:MAG: hypothetical protein KJ645_02415, partial [Planctomycetes bacterium]|nr:hypothetical protein [Planctomycetota bacterium]
NQTQTDFWALNMGKPPSYDPILETEYLCKGNLNDAENDQVLKYLASTYNAESDRITMGIGTRGPRILNFSPILQLGEVPLNKLIAALLKTCELAFGDPVEIEFAVNPPTERGQPCRFGFLQVRPMLVSEDHVEVKEEELCKDNILAASEMVLGNGRLDHIRDVVYVKPETFSPKDTGLIAVELDNLNRRLIDEGCPYLLIVIGRLGTSEPWLGIPVQWGQVGGAKAIVEASTDAMNVDMSQGSHFFHNITCFRVLYFSVDKSKGYPINWQWIEQQEAVSDGRYVRHVKLDKPLQMAVDGKNGRGIISYERPDNIRD